MPGGSVGDHLSLTWTQSDHPGSDQFLQTFFEGSALAGGMSHKLVIDAIFGMMDKMDWFRVSGWPNPPSFKEELVERFDFSLLKGIDHWSLLLGVTRVRRKVSQGEPLH